MPPSRVQQSTKAPRPVRPHLEGNSHELKIIRPYQTIFYHFINFPGHHIGNSLNGTPAPPGMASMQCTCKPSCASSRPCLGTAFLLVDNVGCCLLLRKTPKSQKKKKQLETSQVANHYQPSDQWSFQCAAYSAVAVRSSLQHNWTAQRRSRWPGDSEQWMPKFLQPETLAVWKFFSASNFKKKGKRPTASYSIILDQYSIWHLTSRCVSHVWSTFDSPHLELLRWFGPPPQSGPRDLLRSGPVALEDPGVGGSQQIQLPA